MGSCKVKSLTPPLSAHQFDTSAKRGRDETHFVIEKMRKRKILRGKHMYMKKKKQVTFPELLIQHMVLA